MASSKLYDDILMGHIRDARNYRVMPDAQRHVEVTNPLCGDTFSIYLKLDGERISDLSFQCECCGISMASASIMTEWLRGKSVAQALAIRRQFHEALKNATEDLGPEAHTDHDAVLQVVRQTPSRQGCADLAWVGLENALKQDQTQPAA